MGEKKRDPPLGSLIGACETLSIAEKGVLISLASHCYSSGIAYMKFETLAQTCNISRAQLSRYMHKFEEAGYIKEVGRTKNNIGMYVIVKEKLVEPRQVEKPKGRAVPRKKKTELVEEKQPVTQPKYTFTREEIHAKLEAALRSKKERAQHP